MSFSPLFAVSMLPLLPHYPLQKEGLAEQDIDTFLRDISKQSIQDLFVTPKDIEMQIREIGKLIAGGIDQFQSGME